MASIIAHESLLLLKVFIMSKHLDLNMVINNQEDLDILKQGYAMLVLDIMDISIKEIRSFPVKLVKKIKIQNHYNPKFQSYYNASCNHNEITILEGMTAIDTLVALSHEYGHIISLTGQIKPMVIAEMTAYNFQWRFIKVFNDIFNMKIVLTNLPFFKLFKISPNHAIASIFLFLPFGRILKQKFKQ